MQDDRTKVRAGEPHSVIGADASPRLPRLIGWFEALASIATGGAELGRVDLHPELLYRHGIGPKGPLRPDGRLVMPVIEAEAKLLHAAANAELRIFGLPGTEAKWPGGQLREVPPEAFASVRDATQGVKLLHATPAGAGPALRLSPDECWWDLRVESAALQCLWLEHGEDGQDEAAPSGSTPADAPPTDATAKSAPRTVRPVYSDAGLRTWFRIRIASWPKDTPLPTEREDLVAARSHFDRVARDRFRDIRRDTVPESWLKPGPRRAPKS